MILSQTVLVSSETGLPFNNMIYDSGFRDMTGANQKQAFRRSLGNTFEGDWHVQPISVGTEYQRYFEADSPPPVDYPDWLAMMEDDGWIRICYDIQAGECEWRHENGTMLKPQAALQHYMAGTTPPPF